MNQKNQVSGDHYRFTVITNKMIRMEYQSAGQFEDATTQTVVNRDFGKPDFQVIRDQEGLLSKSRQIHFTSIIAVVNSTEPTCSLIQNTIFRRTIRVGITVIPMSRTCLERPER